MPSIEERTTTIRGTQVFYLGVAHWMGKEIQNKLTEIDPDAICAEAPPNSGFTNRMDQKTVETHLSAFGTPVVMMDSSNRPTRQELVDRFGEEIMKKLNNATGREEVKQIDREVFRVLFQDREQNVMIPRIRQCAKSQSGGRIAVVVGSEHLDGLVNTTPVSATTL